VCEGFSSTRLLPRVSSSVKARDLLAVGRSACFTRLRWSHEAPCGFRELESSGLLLSRCGEPRHAHLRFGGPYILNGKPRLISVLVGNVAIPLPSSVELSLDFPPLPFPVNTPRLTSCPPNPFLLHLSLSKHQVSPIPKLLPA
jgi:hypothetical protein